LPGPRSRDAGQRGRPVAKTGGASGKPSPGSEPASSHPIRAGENACWALQWFGLRFRPVRFRFTPKGLRLTVNRFGFAVQRFGFGLERFGLRLGVGSEAMALRDYGEISGAVRHFFRLAGADERKPLFLIGRKCDSAEPFLDGSTNFFRRGVHALVSWPRRFQGHSTVVLPCELPLRLGNADREKAIGGRRRARLPPMAFFPLVMIWGIIQAGYGILKEGFGENLSGGQVPQDDRLILAAAGQAFAVSGKAFTPAPIS
jgi:hypothetical protein